AWQWRNRVHIAEKTQKILNERQVASRVLPLPFLVPYFRSCGEVEDEQLQDAWARLLAAAITDDAAQHVAFVQTLQQLSPLDVRVLNALIRNEAIGAHDERVAAIVGATGLSA